MAFLPVTALAAWKRCPCSFYVSNVLKVRPELNAAMALGLAKHKLFELWPSYERKLALEVNSENIAERFSSGAVSVARSAVRLQSRTLKKVDLVLPSVFRELMPVAKMLSDTSVSRLSPLLERGLSGESLWDAVSPKVKSEYSVKSDKLRVKGRIDVLECFSGKVLPVELKSGRTPSSGVFDAHRIQAGCYALMLEEMFDTNVPESVVYYIDSNSRRSVVLNAFLREEVYRISGLAHACLESGRVPVGCGKCDSCRYLKAN